LLVWFHLSDGFIAGPMHGEKGLLVADIDVSDARASRRKFDACGHYARADVFTLKVNRTRQTPILFET
jgi:nitrilase